MALYTYQGPIYKYGRKVSDDIRLFTNAKSHKGAIRNFLHRLGKGADIITPYVRFVEPDYDEMRADIEEYDRNNQNVNKFCPHCNNHLSDSGICPLCDNSDYSIYDEIKLMKDIDDGKYVDY
jgi:hypothetical protein